MKLAFLWTLVLAAVAIPQTPPAQPVQPAKAEPPGSIEGRVVNAVTGEPINKATVLAIRTNGRGERLSATTDSAGRYLLPNVTPGEYRIAATRNGYAAGSANRGLGSAQMVKVASGQAHSNVAVKLTPQAVVTGKVVDEDNEPVQGAGIQIFRFSYTGGRRELVPTSAATTNDLGEYRIYGLNPAKVVVAASLRGQDGMRGPGGVLPMPAGAPVRAPEYAYPPVYFPNAATASSAAPLQLTPGAEMRGIDFQLRRARAVRVSGRVVVPGDLRRGGGSVRLIPREGETAGSMMGGGSGGFGRGDNRFVLNNVIPGSYYLVAEAVSDRTPYSAVMPVEIGNQPVDDLMVHLAAPITLKGRFMVDGEATGIDLSKIPIQTRSVGMARYGPSPEAEYEDDGTFELSRLAPSRYRLSLPTLPADCYLKEIRQGNEVRPGFEIDLTAGVAMPLEIVLGANGAQLTGTVTNAQGDPVDSATVVLVPEAERRAIGQYYRSAQSNATGGFSIRGIAPGKYRLFAWQQVESGAWFDPDFLAAQDSTAETVTFSEGGRETRQLKLAANDGTPD